MDSNPSQSSIEATVRVVAKEKKKARARPLPPDVNSRNLAIEKRRRQDMNQVFLDLARCIPSLTSSQKISKRIVAVETLAHLRHQRETRINAGREVRELLFAHDALVAEVNSLRSQLGIPSQSAPWQPSTALAEFLNVENQTLLICPDTVTSPGGERQAVLHNQVQPSPPVDFHPLPPVQASAGDLYRTDYHFENTSSQSWQMPAFVPAIYDTDELVQTQTWQELDVAGLSEAMAWANWRQPWDGFCSDSYPDGSENSLVPSL